MREIFFKASRKKSSSCDSYRKIIKRGGEDVDLASGSDDVIYITLPRHKDITTISIDCNKKTGEFRLFLN